MAVYDISVPVADDVVLYPGEQAPSLRFTAHLAGGDPYTVSRLELGSHTATHVDAPMHFLKDGAGIDQMPVDALCGPCHVVDLTALSRGNIEAHHLETVVGDVPIVLFRTRNSLMMRDGVFRDDYCSLTLEAADRLVRAGIKVVGIDYLSIESAGPHDFPVHKRLLSAGIYIIEGIQLQSVPAGRADLVCLPLRLARAEAAPARAFVRTHE